MFVSECDLEGWDLSPLIPCLNLNYAFSRMSWREGKDELPWRSSCFIPGWLRGSRQMACAQHLLMETEVAEFHPEGLCNVRGKGMHLSHECWEVLQTGSPWKEVQAVINSWMNRRRGQRSVKQFCRKVCKVQSSNNLLLYFLKRIPSVTRACTFGDDIQVDIWGRRWIAELF